MDISSNIKDLLLKSLEDVSYSGIVDDYFISFLDSNSFTKTKLEYKNMIIDDKTYSISFKKNNKLDYNDEVIDIKNNNITKKFHILSLNKIKYIHDYDTLKLKFKEISISKEKPTLLLHSCCGPCSSFVLEFLNPYFKITIFYYNPNINTIEEYNKRLETQKEIVKKLGYDIDIITYPYNHNTYLDYIKGYENNLEGQKRCYLCYEERMIELAKLSKGKFDYFTTTLSISPYKNSNWINEIGIRLENEYNTLYLYSNFKLEEGYKKSIKLSNDYNLYRQDYCGCEFSYNDYLKKLTK